MSDLAFAMGHHLLVFTLLGILAFEIGAVSGDIGPRRIATLVKLDLWYGIIAAAVLAVGFARAIFAAKGWSYYATNVFFWAKIGTFVAIALISIAPTLAFIRWRRAAASDSFQPPAGELARVRGLLWLEAALFAVLPLCAAAMARGYGSFG